MWISREKYEDEAREREEYYSAILSNLKAYQDYCYKLLAENKMLASLANGKTEGCEIGPWCDGCKHKGVIHGGYISSDKYISSAINQRGFNRPKEDSNLP